MPNLEFDTLEEYVPNNGTEAHVVATKVRALARKTAESQAGGPVPNNTVLSLASAKIYRLYPHLRHKIEEYEEYKRLKSLDSFLNGFIKYAGDFKKNTGKAKTGMIHAIMVNDNESIVTETTPKATQVNEVSKAVRGPPNDIRMTPAQLKNMLGKCYRCGNHATAGEPHLARECKWYKDCKLGKA